MNGDKLTNTIKDIQTVLDKLGFQATRDPEEGNIFFMDAEIATSDGMIELFYLYLAVKENYAPAHEKDKPLIISIVVEIDHKLDDDQKIRVLELANLINRQAIGGHLLIDLTDKIVVLKRDISLIKGRLSRVELEWSINELLECAGLYYPLIMERINSNEMLNESSKRSWVSSSYLHRECRSAEQGTTITRGH